MARGGARPGAGRVAKDYGARAGEYADEIANVFSDLRISKVDERTRARFNEGYHLAEALINVCRQWAEVEAERRARDRGPGLGEIER